MSISNFIKEEPFYHAFQPIYNIKSWKRIGYEVLLRSDLYKNPEDVFKEAKKENQLFELDSSSIQKAISTYSRLMTETQQDDRLFLNIYPSTILNQNFLSFINHLYTAFNLDNLRIVFEISESELIDTFDMFKERLFILKEMGCLIAIDDIGRGYSNFKAIIELEPDFLKLDRYFTKDLRSNKQKQSTISFFLDYCNQFNSNLIIEGIETEIDLAVVKTLGIAMAQGYLLGRPEPLKFL